MHHPSNTQSCTSIRIHSYLVQDDPPPIDGQQALALAGVRDGELLAAAAGGGGGGAEVAGEDLVGGEDDVVALCFVRV